MEQIKIVGNDKLYEITDIRNPNKNIFKIVFLDKIPPSYGDIELYTEGGILATTLIGYDTVYREDGQTIYLSDDGSVYEAPETPEVPVEPPAPYEPTMDELRASKLREVSADCEKIIYAGINVTLADGSVEHYSLTEHDQLNLFGKQAQLAAGADRLEYHADGQPCRYYLAADMQTIVQKAMWYVSYHTTYCNALNMWVAGCQTSSDVSAIFYGADVPEQYQSDVLKSYLVQIADMAGGAYVPSVG